MQKQDDRSRRAAAPPRQTGGGQTITLTCANVTKAGPWQEEMRYGSTLNKADYVGVQEHRLTGEAVDMTADLLLRSGWDCIVDTAYLKDVEEGGGTALLARNDAGIRPWRGGKQCAEAMRGLLRGRFTCGIVDLLGGAFIGCFYGISGKPVAVQLQYWKEVATIARAAGLPVILMGDWQATPQEMRSTHFPDLVGAVIVAPDTATNTQSGRVIDYFLVSKDWEHLVQEVHVETGTRLPTHLPVTLRLKGARSLGVARRIAQPKIHSVELPIGPVPAGIGILWDDWLNADCNHDDHVNIDDGDFNDIVSEWYSGAECELNTRFGHAGNDDEVNYTGLGQESREVECPIGNRRQGTPDDAGIIGHRLNWAARGLHVTRLWMFERRQRGSDSATRQRMLRIVESFGHRATAFLREKIIKMPDDEVSDAIDALRQALQLIASTVRRHHGRPPLLNVTDDDDLETAHDRFKRMEQTLAEATGHFVERRRAQKLKAARSWARAASIKASHAATKTKDTATAHSASASKDHLGEMTSQQAADRGIEEWSIHWGAESVDQGDGILENIEELLKKGPSDRALTHEGRYEPIPLEPITGQRVLRAARRFKGSTGLGVDHLRPRHLALLTDAAREALARLFNVIEMRRRWPDLLRRVTAIARAKKAGGSRLLGLAITLYRVWTRIRHQDITEALEARLARPFFAAAPGVGAERAATAAALFCEAAHARGEMSATSTVDISKFYEQIEYPEIADGAMAVGIPHEVIILAIHAYTGPRRIRVDKAWSRPVFPTRSIVAGCTWATVLIRALAIGPTEKFLAAVVKCSGEWEVAVQYSMYVDDLILSTAGVLGAVQWVHAMATRMLVLWMKGAMRKRLADDKLVCIAPTATLRRTLARELAPLGFAIVSEGDLLGVDHSAGGAIKERRIQYKRMKQARRRVPRIKWLRKLGGKAREVARGGAAPKMTYGAKVIGLPPRAAHARRRIQAAASRISASGSSLTAKLALGGEQWCEADPAVLEVAPPFISIIELIWDQPHNRGYVIDAWRQARDTLTGCPPRRRWKITRGPVSAAYAHLLDLDIIWESPFTIRALDRRISLVATPPRQTTRILQEHARLVLDSRLIARLATAAGADVEPICTKYQNGIDWSLIRDTMRNKGGTLEILELRALEAITTVALWAEERRWHAGLLGEGSCRACLCAIGSNQHRVRLCDGVVQHCAFQVAAGRIKPEPGCADDDCLMPLTWHGLPPRTTRWQPVDGIGRQGVIGRCSIGDYYGDGSGTRQQDRDRRRATMALWNPGGALDSADATGAVTAAVTGWFPTAGRGEIAAAICFLDNAPAGSTYVGDCKYVINTLQDRIPWKMTSAAAIDADMWKTAKRALQEKPNMTFRKTKAHRSMAAVARDEGYDGLRDWQGNNRADTLARAACRTLDGQINTQDDADKELYRTILLRVAVGGGWALRHWPEMAPRMKATRHRRRDSVVGSGTLGPHRVRPRGANGIECTDCRLRADTPTSVKSLRNKPCLGPIVMQCHSSHIIHYSDGILWCNRCGRYTSRIPRSLREECPRRPLSEAGQNVLNRLRRGLPPTTAKYLHTVREEAYDESGTANAERQPSVVEREARDSSGMLATGDHLTTGETSLMQHDATSMTTVIDHPAQAHCPPPCQALPRCCHSTSVPTWARRLNVQALSAALLCQQCQGRTRTTCRHCNQPLCLSCARLRRTCSATDAVTSLLPHVNG